VVNSEEVTAGNIDVSGHTGAGGNDDGVIALTNLPPRHINTNVNTRPETRALCLHLGEPLIKVLFLHFEVGNSIPKQSPNPIVSFKHGHRVTDPGELLSGSQTGRSTAHNRYGLTGEALRGNRLNPAFLPRLINNRDFDLLDGHRRLVNSQDTGGFAWCRAETTGELGKVVRFVQTLNGLAPFTSTNEIIPFGDEVPQGTSVVAKRNATIHTAGRLPRQSPGVPGPVNLFPVADSDLDGSPWGKLPVGKLQETFRISHQ
jgi:hypothetical protein